MDKILVAEGGINWTWFTELNVDRKGKTCEIVWHDRLHNDTEICSEYRSWSVWQSCSGAENWYKTVGKERKFAHYNVPGVGWCRVTNSRPIFDYPRVAKNEI